MNRPSFSWARLVIPTFKQLFQWIIFENVYKHLCDVSKKEKKIGDKLS